MTEFQSAILFLGTAAAAGVWVCVGLLVVRLFMLGKGSPTVLALFVLVTCSGSAFAQSSNSTAFSAWPPFTSMGVTYVSGDYSWNSTYGRSYPYCLQNDGAFGALTVSMTSAGGASLDCWVRAPSGSFTLVIKVDGVVQLTRTVNTSWQNVGLAAIPSGSHTITFDPGGSRVLVDDWTLQKFAPLGTYSLSVSPSVVSVRSGEFVDVSVSVTGQAWTGPTSVPVTLSSSLPVSFSSNPVSVPVGSSAVVRMSNLGSPSALAGVVSLTSNSSGYTASAVNVSTSLLPPRSYQLTNSFVLYGIAPQLEFGYGESRTFDVWAESADWVAGPLALSVTDLPAGWSFLTSGSCPVNPVGDSSSRAQITITAPEAQELASFDFNVVSNGGGQIASFSVGAAYAPPDCTGVRSYEWDGTAWQFVSETGLCGEFCGWCYDSLSDACVSGVGPAVGTVAQAHCVNPDFSSCQNGTLPYCFPTPTDPEPEECEQDYCSCVGMSATYTWVWDAFGVNGTWNVVQNSTGDFPTGNKNECTYVGAPAGPWTSGPTTIVVPATGCYYCGTDTDPDTQCENQEGVTGHAVVTMVEFTDEDAPEGVEPGTYWQFVEFVNGSQTLPGYSLAVQRSCLPECGVVGESVELGLVIVEDQSTNGVNLWTTSSADELVAGVACDADSDCIDISGMLEELREVMVEKGLEAEFTEVESGQSPLIFDFNLPYSLDGSYYWPVHIDLRCQAIDLFFGWQPEGVRSSGLVCWFAGLLQTFFSMHLAWLFTRVFIADLGSL